MRRALFILATLIVVAACSSENSETRALEAERKIRESIPDVMGDALAQKVTPEQVKQAQEALKTLSEYLGDPTGKLDEVTVSAIQAFQRTQGIKANGMLTDTTLRSLQEAAAKAQPKQG